MIEREEQIRKAVDDLDEAVAKDALALLLAGTGADAERNGGFKTRTAETVPGTNFANFAQAIGWLKSKYAFQELEAFTTEADLVYVQTGDRRILLTDKSALASVHGKGAQEHAAYQAGRFENAWEPITSAKKPSLQEESSAKTEEETATPQKQAETDMDDAFEPLPKNGRFSNLEL